MKRDTTWDKLKRTCYNIFNFAKITNVLKLSKTESDVITIFLLPIKWDLKTSSLCKLPE